jgi:hypothetical protein
MVDSNTHQSGVLLDAVQQAIEIKAVLFPLAQK